MTSYYYPELGHPGLRLPKMGATLPRRQHSTNIGHQGLLIFSAIQVSDSYEAVFYKHRPLRPFDLLVIQALNSQDEGHSPSILQA